MRTRIIIAALLSLSMAACTHAPHFEVSGSIANADGSTLYLEHTGLQKVTVIDSVVLGSTGAFEFEAPRPANPDLYRLRVDGKTIVLAVDSLDEIVVTAQKEDMLAASFEGSPKSEQIAELRRSLRNNTLEDHKAYATQVIMSDPSSVVAYYALYQQKSFAPVFDLTDKSDRVFYQAVATSWQAWMPEDPRTKSLCSAVLEQINADRRSQNAAFIQNYIDEQESTFLDITLPDENGMMQTLSHLIGNVIILDFCATEMDQYESYLTSLNARYEAYHDKGLEIYQVYPDQSIALWKNQVADLPWTTVRAEGGLVDPVYRTYNIGALPTCFLLDRKGNVVGRFVGFKDINEAIESIL